MTFDSRNPSRRNFLKLGAAAFAGAAMSRAMVHAAEEHAHEHMHEDAYGGLKFGLQSYTLRDRSFEKALDAMKDTLDVHVVEIFPKHIVAMSPPQVLEKLKAHNITAMSYGVIPFKKDADEANRKMFELAKALGLTHLSCDPDMEAAESVDKLCHEYNITVGIHPHGEKHRWGHVEQLHKIFDGRSEMFGLTADTGHLIAAGEDPIKTIELFKNRVHAVHLKDFKKDGEKWEDVPAGEANLDVDALVKTLMGMNFKGGIFIEYEGQRKDDPEHPVKAAQTSLDRVKQAVKKAKA